MGKNSCDFISKIKIYHIILLGYVLDSFYCLNISISNSKLRKLDTTLGCKFASEELLDYYRNGNLSEIDLTDDLLDYPNKNSDYIKTLIGIENNLFYRDIEEINDEEDGENFDKENELKESIKKKFKPF